MPTKTHDSRVGLTKTVVENAPVPESGQAFLRDAELRGFALRITPSGTKTFVLEKRIEGRNRRMRIGRFGEITVAQARTRAQQLLGQIAFGEDPMRQRQKERARSLVLNQAYADYCAARHSLAPKTRMDYDRAIYVVLKDWGDRPLSSINRAMISKRHRELAESRGEQGANNYMRVLRAVFSFAMDNYEDGDGQPVFTHNPVLVLTRTRSWYRMERRRGVIKVHELPTWYRAVESLRENEHVDSLGDTVADFLLFLLFTGLRRSEAASLKWQDVDLQGEIFTIRQTKSHRPHTLPCSPFVHDLFVKRLGCQKNEYVFCGKSKSGKLVEPKRQIKHVVETSGIPFSSHDLRRTFITVAEAINLSLYTIKRLANHSTGGDVTAGYIISDTERLRGPMCQIERYLLSAIRSNIVPKVVSMRRK